MILEESPGLRLTTVFLFYFTQGAPIGLFFYAIPAWLAANGASTAAVAGVVSSAVMPWMLKFFMGFVMDRYTYLPMGRRRIWIIGAQSSVVAVLVLGAALSPQASDIWLLSLLGFLTNAGTAVQDVSIDSLAVDIMPEDERAKAAGIMFGGQILGISATTFAGGQLIALYGVQAGYLVAAMLVAMVLGFGICIREREGERRLPWSDGSAHPRNEALRIDAWMPLLTKSAKSMIAPLSLVALVVFLTRGMLPGVAEAFHPGLATSVGGWEQTQYTNTISAAQLAVGVFALTVGGWAVAKMGAQKATLVLAIIIAICATGFGLARSQWNDSLLLTLYFWQAEFMTILFAVAIIPIAMRLCDPSVAATQFTLYMAAANVGRPLGNSVAATADGMGSPQMMYFILAGVFGLIAIIMTLVRFPTQATAAVDIIEQHDPIVAGEPVPKLN